MNKKILAVAIAGTFVAPFAMADVTIYGLISAAVQSASTSNSYTTDNYPSRGRVSDQNSRIGFKGTEDLGNGTSTVWQVESSLKSFEQGGTNDQGQAATFATRNSFLGLKDNTFGQVVMGYYDSAYKRYTNVGADLMADTSASTMGDNSGVYNIVGRGDSRLKNSIHYDSPLWNGFQAGASYGFDEYITTGSSKDAARMSLGASYTNGPLKIGAGYDRLNDSTATLAGSSSFPSGFVFNSTQTSTSTTYVGQHSTYAQLAGSYLITQTNTLLTAMFERATYTSVKGGSDMTQNDWSLGVAQTFGNFAVKLSYNKLGDLNNAYSGNPSDYDANEWVLGTTYNLSKQTQLLAYATRIDNSKYQNANLTIDPLEASPASSVGGSYTNLNSGSVIKVFGVGMKYTF